jgi:hypothetical protein
LTKLLPFTMRLFSRNVGSLSHISTVLLFCRFERSDVISLTFQTCVELR